MQRQETGIEYACSHIEIEPRFEEAQRIRSRPHIYLSPKLCRIPNPDLPSACHIRMYLNASVLASLQPLVEGHVLLHVHARRRRSIDAIATSFAPIRMAA